MADIPGRRSSLDDSEETSGVALLLSRRWLLLPSGILAALSPSQVGVAGARPGVLSKCRRPVAAGGTTRRSPWLRVVLVAIENPHAQDDNAREIKISSMNATAILVMLASRFIIVGQALFVSKGLTATSCCHRPACRLPTGRDEESHHENLRRTSKIAVHIRLFKVHVIHSPPDR